MELPSQVHLHFNREDGEAKAIKDVLEKAIPLQVHRKTDFPPMNKQLGEIYSELAQLRKVDHRQIRKAERVKKHLDVIVLDLWVAANYSKSPWRRISLNRNDYSKGTRYRKIFLKYDLVKSVLIDLISLGYVEDSSYYHNSNGKSRQTRIKATSKLLDLLNFDIKKIERDPEAPEEETIIKKDEGGRIVDYIDDRFTIQMRDGLKAYNNLLRQTDIGTDGIDLRYKYDPTNITVKRIFNGESGGGRFYSAFWMNMPKEDRLKLRINGEEVCELDYSAFHATIAYSLTGLSVSDDPYTIPDCDRKEVKKAFLVLFNCKSREHAINTIRSEFHIKNAQSLLLKIEKKHEAISNSFFNPGFGLHLQNIDSWLAENIINRLTKKGIVCLSVHDSFIVAKRYELELRNTMESTFQEKLNFKPIIK